MWIYIETDVSEGFSRVYCLYTAVTVQIVLSGDAIDPEFRVSSYVEVLERSTYDCCAASWKYSLQPMSLHSLFFSCYVQNTQLLEEKIKEFQIVLSAS